MLTNFFTISMALCYILCVCVCVCVRILWEFAKVTGYWTQCSIKRRS